MKSVVALLLLCAVVSATRGSIDWYHFDKEEATFIVKRAIDHFKSTPGLLDGTFNGPSFSLQVGEDTWAFATDTKVSGFEETTRLKDDSLTFDSQDKGVHKIGFQMLMPSLLVTGNFVLYNRTQERHHPKFRQTLDLTVASTGPDFVFNIDIEANHIQQTIGIRRTGLHRDSKYFANMNCTTETPEWMCKSAKEGLERDLNGGSYADRNMILKVFDFFDVLHNYE